MVTAALVGGESALSRALPRWEVLEAAAAAAKKARRKGSADVGEEKRGAAAVLGKLGELGKAIGQAVVDTTVGNNEVHLAAPPPRQHRGLLPPQGLTSPPARDPRPALARRWSGSSPRRRTPRSPPTRRSSTCRRRRHRTRAAGWWARRAETPSRSRAARGRGHASRRASPTSRARRAPSPPPRTARTACPPPRCERSAPSRSPPSASTSSSATSRRVRVCRLPTGSNPPTTQRAAACGHRRPRRARGRPRVCVRVHSRGHLAARLRAVGALRRVQVEARRDARGAPDGDEA